MKGILLAGGTGSRLGECTKVTNKHLLVVYNKPMIYYPLNTLQKAGIEDIIIITGGNHIGKIAELLEDGSNFSVNLTYRVQKEAGGIAQALSLAKGLSNHNNVAVILGDNYFEDNLKEDFDSFKAGSKIFLKEVKYPKRFGIAEIEGNRIINIVEKPSKPKTNYAVTGLYLYDNNVFDLIETLSPSDRGELEITDVNNKYIQDGSMNFSILQNYWGDMGEPDTLLETATYILNKNRVKS